MRLVLVMNELPTPHQEDLHVSLIFDATAFPIEVAVAHAREPD